MSGEAGVDPSRFTLTPEQHDLLDLALSSNSNNSSDNNNNNKSVLTSDSMVANAMAANGGGSDPTASSASPVLDNSFDDANFEWDEGAEDVFGDGQFDDGDDTTELHEKRKASAAPDDASPANSKRRESEGRTGKKPGRKLVTTEPATKRKAQNRAAQRAFRERKERHLLDLETKVEDLEKASEATNHENGRLRAQVDKLTNELNEYRKRFSVNATAAGYSPPRNGPRHNMFAANDDDFSFSFPKFGSLPGSSNTSKAMSLNKTVQSPVNGTTSNGPSPASSSAKSPPAHVNPSVVANSLRQTASPPSTNGSSAVKADLDALNGLFSPSILASVSSEGATDDYISYNSASQAIKDAHVNHNNNTDKKTSLNSAVSTGSAGPASRVGRMSSASFTNSPISSPSNIGLDSSTGTTPEPYTADSSDLQKPLSNTASAQPKPLQGNATTSTFPALVKSPASEVKGFNWMAQQNGGQFDPVLFGDYRDPQDNILTNGSFDDFFNDALPPSQDFSSPYNTGDQLPSESKKDLMSAIESTQNGEGAVEPPTTGAAAAAAAAGSQEVEGFRLKAVTAPGVMPSHEQRIKQIYGCEELWQRVQNSEILKNGEADMDDLCAQLKSKAKCTGNGPMIAEKDLTAILGPPGPAKTDEMFKVFR